MKIAARVINEHIRQRHAAPLFLHHEATYTEPLWAGFTRLGIPVQSVTKVVVRQRDVDETIPLADVRLLEQGRYLRIANSAPSGRVSVTGTWGWGTLAGLAESQPTPGDTTAGYVYHQDGKLSVWDGTIFEAVIGDIIDPNEEYHRVVVPEDLEGASQIVAQTMPTNLSKGSLNDMVATNDGWTSPNQMLVPAPAAQLLRSYV